MKTFLFVILVIAGFATSAQSKKDKAKQESTFLKDSAQILKEITDNTCRCVDSISVIGKSQAEITTDIAGCIEKQSVGFEMIIKLMKGMEDAKSSGAKKVNISVDPDKKEHNQYYFDIERLLTDSCAAVKKKIASNNKESGNSYSSDQIAMELFNKGVAATKREDFEEAVNYYRKAVTRDERFVFAWDNLGISLRRTGKYADAVKAYERSLSIDSSGSTALQNLPVVYQLMKDPDKAIESYKRLIRIYPESAEGYYGLGQVYLGKMDLENSLSYMCKAYIIYIKQGSPYRVDTEKIISFIYSEMKKQNKEEAFYKILSDNNLSPNKK